MMDRATAEAEKAAQEEHASEAAREAASETEDDAVGMDGVENAAVPVSATFGLVQPARVG